MKQAAQNPRPASGLASFSISVPYSGLSLAPKRAVCASSSCSGSATFWQPAGAAAMLVIPQAWPGGASPSHSLPPLLCLHREIEPSGAGVVSLVFVQCPALRGPAGATAAGARGGPSRGFMRWPLLGRFCEVEFQGPLSIQEEWVRHLQRHILEMNFSKVDPLRSEAVAPEAQAVAEAQ